jgi:YD repeat-containing protein
MTVGNDTTDYLLDGQDVVREIKNGVVEAQYLVGPRGPEYRRDAQGNVEWYVYDGLGSVVMTVGDDGSRLTTRTFNVGGARMPCTASP